MFSIHEMPREAARSHALYRKTRNEIANLPLDVALDPDLSPGGADRIAREAVHGRAT